VGAGVGFAPELREVCARLRAAATDGWTVFVSPEMAGLGTVGGLGVMVGHLSGGLAAHGHVAVIMPAYERFQPQWQHATPLCDLVVPLGASRVEVQVLRTVTEHGVAVEP